MGIQRSGAPARAFYLPSSSGGIPDHMQAEVNTMSVPLSDSIQGQSCQT